MDLISVTRLFGGELAGRLVALRRDLHRHPELSLREERTRGRLEEALSGLPGVSIRRVAGTGLVARVAGRDRNAPVVAIRGDIDALPIQEATGLDFASQTPGVMHACGHDVHATWTVGAAHLLAADPAEGDVLVVFQPAEEIGAGARAILESGALDGARVIFGAHVDRRFALGEVVVVEGPVAASADTFQVVLKGVGAHAARPHEGADPIVGLGALISALQTVVSRKVNPADAAVVTIGKVVAGTAPNIIPDEARLNGTLRAVKPEVRALLHKQVCLIAENIAKAYGLVADVAVNEGSPPIVNPSEATAWAREAAERLLGAEALRPLGFLNLGGEDFAHYMEHIPGCFMRIGAREPGGEIIPAHAPHFYAAEESIFIGAALLAEAARTASRTLAASSEAGMLPAASASSGGG